VLLDENDTCELLRNLDIVLQGATLSPSIYLRSLANLRRRKIVIGKAIAETTRQGDVRSSDRYDERTAESHDALDALDAVRMAATRNLSRIDMYI
jgi:hypothetical protein